MKAYSEIENSKDIITWDIVDFFTSLQHYSAQELKDVEAMIGVCIQEVKAWNAVINKEFFEYFDGEYFIKECPEDMDKLSRLVTIEHYLLELNAKLKLTKYYSYLKMPDCFKH